MREKLYRNISISLAIITAIILVGLFIYILEPKDGMFAGADLLFYFLYCCLSAIGGGIIIILLRFLFFRKQKQYSFKKNFFYIFFCSFNLYIFLIWLTTFILKIEDFEINSILYLLASFLIAVFMIIDILMINKRRNEIAKV